MSKTRVLRHMLEQQPAAGIEAIATEQAGVILNPVASIDHQFVAIGVGTLSLINRVITLNQDQAAFLESPGRRRRADDRFEQLERGIMDIARHARGDDMGVAMQYRTQRVELVLQQCPRLRNLDQHAIDVDARKIDTRVGFYLVDRITVRQQVIAQRLLRQEGIVPGVNRMVGECNRERAESVV